MGKLFALRDCICKYAYGKYKTLWYEFSDVVLKFRLRKDVEYIYNSRLIQTRDNKKFIIALGKNSVQGNSRSISALPK